MEWTIPRNCDGKKPGFTALRMGLIVFSSLWLIMVFLMGELRWWSYVPQSGKIWLSPPISLHVEDIRPSPIHQRNQMTNKRKPMSWKHFIFKRWANKWDTMGTEGHGSATDGHSSMCLRNKKSIKEWRKQIKAYSGPSKLIKRSRAVKHDITIDGNLIRYMELCQHSMNCSGIFFLHRMEKTVNWREENWKKEFSPLRGIPSQPVMKLASQGIIFVEGKDWEGHPLLHLRPGLLGKLGYDTHFTTDNAMSLLIYNIERAVSTMHVGVSRMGVIVDCRGVGLNSLPSIRLIMDAFQLISEHYPVRLKFTLFLHASHAVDNAWRLVSMVLDNRILQKVKFLSGKGLHTALRHNKIPNAIIEAYHLTNNREDIRNLAFDVKDYFAKNPLGTSADGRY